MRHGSLFSGIGGFDLAAEWMGWENVFHCEWNEFGQKILKHYWPHAKSYSDITKTDFTIHRGGIDILTGGFPCQPFSAAGKRKGTEDNRYLWPEMLRAIREIQPHFVVGENVGGLVNWDRGMVFEQVQADLETAGYESAAFILPASAVNALHRRDRVWFIANTNGGMLENDWLRSNKSEGIYKNTSIKGHDRAFIQRFLKDTHGSLLCEFDGVPGDLDRITLSEWRRESIKAFGNAIVPQVAYEIFKAIESTPT